MAQALSAPGLGLPVPQNLYPSELFNTAYDTSNSFMTLNAGDAITIPSGNWFCNFGRYSVRQHLDPFTSTWISIPAARGQLESVTSDGFTQRIFNPLGCAVAGIVTAIGSGYTAGGVTITPSTGNSTWAAIVGGALGTPTITAAGSGFSMTPIVFIPGPPSTSIVIPATAYATTASGTVNAVSLVNSGAGYTQATVTALLLPNPFDPNIANAVPGTVVFPLANAGAITGVVCTNSGAPIAAASLATVSLSVTGGGSGATVSPVVIQTVTSVTVGGGGVAFGNATNAAKITTAGGKPLGPINANQVAKSKGLRPCSSNVSESGSRL